VAWALPCLYDATTNRPLLVGCLLIGEGRFAVAAALAQCITSRLRDAPFVCKLCASTKPTKPTPTPPPQGSANVCPNNLAGADPDSAVSVLVHELLHSLGFTDDSFDKFVDDSGAPVPKDQVVKEVTDPYGK
jgi:hypothetical protein